MTFKSILWSVLLCTTPLYAGKPAASSLREDINALSVEVLALRAEVSGLTAEVQGLKKEVEVQKLARDTLSDPLREKIQKMITEAITAYAAQALSTQLQAFSLQISAELTALAEQFRVALNHILAVLGAQQVLSSTVQGKNPEHSEVYEVKAGETLEGIAKKFDTTIEVIEKLNFFVQKGQVTPGMMLLIPARGAK